MDIDKAKRNAQTIEVSKAVQAKKETQELQLKKKQGDVTETRRMVIKSMLTTEAYERFARIKIVKGGNVQHIEEMLCKYAQSGLSKKLTEDQLITLVEQFEGMAIQKDPAIQIRRRRVFEDESDDISGDDL